MLVNASGSLVDSSPSGGLMNSKLQHGCDMQLSGSVDNRIGNGCDMQVSSIGSSVTSHFVEKQERAGSSHK